MSVTHYLILLREMERHLEQQRATQRYIEEFLDKREEWKTLEQEKMEQENARILEFAKQQQAREEVRQKERRAQEETKAAVQKRLADEMARKQDEEEEMER